MTTLKILTESRKLIEKGWCQGYYAMDGAGNWAYAEATTASQWCPLGALSKTRQKSPVSSSLDLLEQSAGVTNISKWNDDPKRTKEQVLAMFDGAIALATADASN